jgi:hypothetical protein
LAIGMRDACRMLDAARAHINRLLERSRKRR